ncbi:hypothetical protein FKP32DRAFT_1139823 [Trametes sanguinea]|nr:hypothetical protein FKP32DRAFT_1139823 [Trametes sanguinea]
MAQWRGPSSSSCCSSVPWPTTTSRPVPGDTASVDPPRRHRQETSFSPGVRCLLSPLACRPPPCSTDAGRCIFFLLAPSSTFVSLLTSRGLRDSFTFAGPKGRCAIHGFSRPNSSELPPLCAVPFPAVPGAEHPRLQLGFR